MNYSWPILRFYPSIIQPVPKIMVIISIFFSSYYINISVFIFATHSVWHLLGNITSYVSFRCFPPIALVFCLLLLCNSYRCHCGVIVLLCVPLVCMSLCCHTNRVSFLLLLLLSLSLLRIINVSFLNTLPSSKNSVGSSCDLKKQRVQKAQKNHSVVFLLTYL
jgi:hypothetical protein